MGEIPLGQFSSKKLKTTTTTTTEALDLLLGTAVRQTDFDVTLGQSVVSDRNPACAIFIRHKTLSDG